MGGLVVKPWAWFSGALPQVVQLSLSLPHMPSGLQGKRLLFVTDLHYGPWLGDAPMSRIVDEMLEQSPDLILLGGDLAEGIRAQERFCKRHLPRLRTPMGVFCVPGNNDCEAVQGEYRLWERMVGDAGAVLLLNRRVYLRVQGGRLAISGLDESKYGRPDCRVVRQTVEPSDVHLVLTHSPWALALVMDPAYRVDMALCGHTHGGQIALGGACALAMGYYRAGDRPYFYLSGDHMTRGTRVLVSNGIGCSLLPVRVGAPPQIHVITLSRV